MNHVLLQLDDHYHPVLTAIGLATLVLFSRQHKDSGVSRDNGQIYKVMDPDESQTSVHFLTTN